MSEPLEHLPPDPEPETYFGLHVDDFRRVIGDAVAFALLKLLEEHELVVIDQRQIDQGFEE